MGSGNYVSIFLYYILISFSTKEGIMLVTFSEKSLKIMLNKVWQDIDEVCYSFWMPSNCLPTYSMNFLKTLETTIPLLSKVLLILPSQESEKSQ